MAWPTVLQAIGAIVRRELQQDGVLRLEEPGLPEPERRRCAVTLHKRGPAVAIKLDARIPRACHRADCDWTFSVNDRFFPLFRQDEQGLCGACDYLVFYVDQAHTDRQPVLHVFLCELKSGGAGHAKAQVENSKLLAEYILAMARYHHRLADEPLVLFRGLIFSPRQPPLKPTIGNRSPQYIDSARVRDLKLLYVQSGTEWHLDSLCDRP